MSGDHGGDRGGESSDDTGALDGARDAAGGVAAGVQDAVASAAGDAVERATPSRRTLLTMLASAGAGAALARHEDVADALGGATGVGGDGGVGLDLLPGQDGHHNEAALALVPTDDATHVATGSGAWDDPGTWDGEVPTDGARVHVPAGTIVTLRHRDAAELKWVRVDGALVVDPSVDTHLQAETIVTTPESALRVGTAEDPVGPEREASFTFADFGPIDETADPERLGTGLIAMGSVDVHGAEKTTWSELAKGPGKGETSLSLPDAPTNWHAGDRLVVPGMHPETDQDEEVFVERVDGTTVHLDRELEYDHAPPADDLSAYVVALDRPVRFRSANQAVPRRGHVMVMTPETTVKYAAFEGLGRTDKSYPFTNPQHGTPPEDVPPNPRARYAFHFHETGIDEAPHTVEGIAVDGSPGWGVVNHHSHAEVTDSVTYDVFGAGFVAEAGNERGAFRRNFALRSTGSGEHIDSREFHSDDDHEPGEVDDFGHGGHGFWLQGPMVELADNVAAGHRYFAFVLWNRPLIDRELRPGEKIDRLRGTVANTPLEYVDQPYLADSDHVNDDEVSSAYVALNRIEGNVAFASAGGLDVSRHQFGWDHTRVADWSEVSDFTAFNVGAFRTHWDKVVEPAFANHRGANTAVNVRYSSNIRFSNLRLESGRGRDRVGFGRNVPYPFNVSVTDSDVRGFQEGLRAMVRGITRVTNTRFANATNVAIRDEHRWPRRKIQIQDCTFERGADEHVATELAPLSDLNATELFTPHESTVRLDGRDVYYPEQRADYVPLPDREAKEALGDTAGLNELTGGEADGVVGKTNRELEAGYGLATKAEITPSGTVADDRVPGRLQAAADASAHEAWLQADAGDLAEPWVVEESRNASNGRYVTTHGVESAHEPPSEGHATYTFDVEGGTYRILGRVQVPDDSSDSFWLRVDDGAWTRWDRIWTRRGSWVWAPVPDHDREDAPPKRFDLGEGSHTLTVAFREDDARLDKLVVTATDSPPVLFGDPVGE
jgi:hypothetical protein